jgi:hypothetical protein
MKELRWLAEYVIEFSNMRNDIKEIALDFIAEADDTQLKVLLVDGLLVLDADEKLVENEFIKSPVSKLLEYKTSGRKTAMSVAGLLGVFYGGPVTWAVYRTIRAAFDKCTEKCGTYKINNAERQICMQKCKEERDRKLSQLKAKVQKEKSKK